MTDDERRNRNPAPEACSLPIQDCPELRTADLELHKVYILQGPARAASLNYMGKRLSRDPRTLDTVMTYHFHGPRVGLHVFLKAGPEGSLQDADGNKITLRKYTGPDQ